MSLTDTICKNAKPKEKAYKVYDSAGLYLHIMPTGSKLWRFRYKLYGKEKLISLGAYPTVKLADARKKLQEAKKQLENNIDPSRARKEEQRDAIKQISNSFKNVALEWIETQRENWKPKYFTTVQRRLDNDIIPYLGDFPISQIKTTDLYDAIKKIEERGALHLIKKVRQHCGQIFTYAMLLGKCQSNPALHLQRAFKTRKTKHHPAIEPHEIPNFLQKLDQNDNRFYPRTIRAIRLSLLTFVRPSELRKAKWVDIDFKRKEWKLPADVMKSRRDFIVPLSNQAIKILNKQKLETGHINTEYVFPNQIRPKEPMSSGTVLQALYRLGMKDKMTAHGFRALARTTIREELGTDADIIEIQLAHKPINPLGEAYDRTKFIKQRHVMMQEWADYIDRITLEAKNKVVAFKS
ncbi:tyrosine-type recombinase/integrase [Flavobacterium sp. TBRC 19031]|uniref:tyrosine-type recombinase/integrase n=1 Tax=Flavobacterium mekongense TaxID=3379707 RepID=UPI003999D19D